MDEPGEVKSSGNPDLGVFAAILAVGFSTFLLADVCVSGIEIFAGSGGAGIGACDCCASATAGTSDRQKSSL